MKLFICALFIVLVMAGQARAASFAWDRETDPTVTKYTVYGCFTAGCVVTASPTLKQADIAQPASGVVPLWPVPANTQGMLAVTASNSNGESAMSVPLPFNLLVPAPPVNLRLQ